MINSKILKFNPDSRSEMLEGVSILASAVGITMGPKGLNVVIENPGSHPIVTKDGVTVAKAVCLKDKLKNLGAEIVKESASRTADTAGDGTTTATVLAHSIFLEGTKMLAAGHTSKSLVSGINSCVSDVILEIEKMSKPIDGNRDILQVATISANGEKEIGELITDAVSRLGSDGVITVERAKGFKSDLVIVEGMQINRGYLSPYFVNDSEKMIVEFENPAILLYNKKISSMSELSSLLEESLQSSRPILIIADDVEGDAMQGLVVNTSRGNLKACAIKSPGFGNARVGMMQDLSLILGSNVYGSGSEEEVGQLKLSDLGTCDKVIITRSDTVFVGGDTSQGLIDERTESLKEALENDRISDDEAGVIRLRLSRLSGGVGIIRVGGATEGELIERKDRVDDALHATQAAIQEGVVPGGGVCLIRASKRIDISKYGENQVPGASIVLKSCESPLRQIVKNAGGVPDVVIEKLSSLESSSDGYDAAIGKFVNMVDAGILDPAKVTRCALENAASAACTLLSVGCTMVYEDQED
tara:strand:+ start:4868 stop:6460 length:1593 start_codon:yes stop_codon:yes gene_type:complete